MKKLIFSALAFTALAFGANAQDDILKKAINNPAVASYQIFGATQTNSEIADTAVQGGKARRVIIASGSDQPWTAAAQMPITGKMAKGERIVAAVWLKAAVTENGAPGTVTLRLQQSSAPYTGLAQKTVTLKPTWELYTVDVSMPEDYAKGTANLALQLAHAKQTIDIGPAFVLNMGPKAQ